MMRLPRSSALHRTESGVLNQTIIRGLLAIAFIDVVGMLGLLAWRIAVPEVMPLIASNIAAGLLGYLAREPKPGSTVGALTEHADTVRVEAPAGSPITEKESEDATASG